MARAHIPDEASDYYPPRAKWYSVIFSLGDAARRCVGLERMVMPRTMTIGDLVLGFFIPGLSVWLRGPKLWGRAALFVCAELMGVFIVWIGYPYANFAFGLLLSVHCTGLVYYCSPMMVGEPFRSRLAFTALVLLLLALLLYLPSLHFLQKHFLTPLRRGDHVLVVRHISHPGQIHRGDWVAYALDENAMGENYHGGTVILHSGVTMGQVLALPGDAVTFSNNLFFVNGTVRTNLPHMPASGGFIVAEKHWFIWPNLGISGHGDVGEARLSAALMGLANVPEENFFGKPFQRWFWRKQVLP